jgi:kumamolisin
MKVQNPLSKLPQLHLPAVLLATFLAAGMCPAFGAGAKSLPGHVPAAVRQLKPNGGLPGTTELRLAIGVPLRDPAGLNQFLGELYNPASPNYHRYLTPDEFTARFAATEADYAAVKRFALAAGSKSPPSTATDYCST